MLQLSCDRRRLYVTNSLLSTWDNQFYPELRSYLLKIDIGDDGTMAVDPSPEFEAARDLVRVREDAS
jgi:methanethiol oxidase